MITAKASVFAPAKINLFLHVGRRRADGYHALQSLAVFVNIGDTLRIAEAAALRLSIDGPFAADLSAGEDNLVIRAARALDAERSAHLLLRKDLPVASGIGGGSADAAAALRGLRHFWGLDAGDDALLHIAASLGSDVPVCVKSEPAWMEGRGEVLTPLARMPTMPIVLVNPGVAVATADVFRALDARTGTDGARPVAPFRNAAGVLDFLAATRNDLETPARAIRPVIGEVLDALAPLPGARLARMSGSGATCFTLFDSGDQADAAAKTLRERRPGWWVQAGETDWTVR